MTRPKGLGRGLEALLERDTASGEALASLPVSWIRPGKYQPRTRMDQTSLAELAASIRAQGLMQPVIVRAVGTDRYELIAGERRWRAAQLAGLEQIPALVRDIPDNAALAMSLIENIQREDLNPIEEATGLQRLIDEFSMTHEQAAAAIGRSRSATTNLLRLLKLPPPVRAQVMDGSLEMGHARALLAIENASRQIDIANKVATRGLSVRETEALVSSAVAPPKGTAKSRPNRDLLRLEEDVSERLGTTVQIRANRRGAGRLIVQFAGLDHLDELLRKLR